MRDRIAWDGLQLGPTADYIDDSYHLGAVKALAATQLAMATDAMHSVSLDEAIEAMRLTAADMSIKYKETSLSVSVVTRSSFSNVDTSCSGSCCMLFTRVVFIF